MADKSSFPSTLAERFQLRMPDGMRDRIAELAKQSGRSMNSEIVARLENSFDADWDQAIKVVESQRDELAHQRAMIEKLLTIAEALLDKARK